MEKNNIKKILDRINDIEGNMKMFIFILAFGQILLALFFFVKDMPVEAFAILTIANIMINFIGAAYNAGKRSELKDYLKENYDK